MKIMKNSLAYEFAPFRKRHRIMVDVVLDDVHGVDDTIERHVNILFESNPYIVSAIVEQKH